MSKRLVMILALALGVAGCGAGTNDPAVGGVTQGEADALNRAADMLDESGNDVRLTNAAAPAPKPPAQAPAK